MPPQLTDHDFLYTLKSAIMNLTFQLNVLSFSIFHLIRRVQFSQELSSLASCSQWPLSSLAFDFKYRSAFGMSSILHTTDLKCTPRVTSSRNLFHFIADFYDYSPEELRLVSYRSSLDPQQFSQVAVCSLFTLEH